MVKSRQIDYGITYLDPSASLHEENRPLKVMADPKDDGMGGRAAYDSDRSIQEDHRILGRARHEGRRRWPFVVVGVAVVIGVLAVVWDWDWFRPLIEREASASLGRKVTLQHLGLRLGRQTVVVANGLRIANPEGFAQDAPLATVERVTVTIDTLALLRHRAVVVPDVLVEQPRIAATQAADGSANYLFPSLSFGGNGPGVRLGSLRITDGQVHVLLARPRADFNVAIETRDNENTPQLVAEAKGTYAAQLINANFVGGALLSLRDAATAYPVDLKVANGATHARLVGTVQDPQNFAGADLKLELAGTDMQLLLPLIGIAFPKTPSYQIKGDLDYADGKIRFRNFTGQLGSSDVEGNLEVDPGQKRPVVTADVTSRQVDLADLGGFLGSEPGRMITPNQTPEQHQAVARAEASPRLLPTTRISLPKLLAADVHLKYRGAKIQGRNMPFDSFAADMDIIDGRIHLHPVSIGVGQGRIAGTVEIEPLNDEQFRTKADIAVQRVDLGRMLKATNLVGGSGVIGGRAMLESTGNSMATMVTNGNGSLQLTMAGGGDLSALLVDLSGLQFGNALLSALGIPDRDKIECFLADFALQRGELQTRALLLDTTSDIISGSGAINLRTETLDYQIKTEAKHFTIGALPAPISIKGSFKDPGALPDITKLAARGGVAAGLGILFPPAAILPTIQFGVGDDHRCESLSHRGK
jgi:AsmA family protein